MLHSPNQNVMDWWMISWIAASVLLADSMPLLLYRRFAKSGKFSGVVAADFSETMLQQARSYFREDGTLGGSTPIALLRADVARLPFATGSLAAIHAGGDTRRCAAIEEGRSA